MHLQNRGGVMTIKDILEQSVARAPEKIFLQYKRAGKWSTLSFTQLRTRARMVAELLARLGVAPRSRVGLCRENSVEWFELYFGIVGYGAVTVPIDARLREQEVTHILHDSSASVVFCSAGNVGVLSEHLDRFPALQAVVVLNGQADALPNHKRIQFVSYETCMDEVAVRAQEDGAAYDRHAPYEEDTASLIYTSGTSGRPKGALLTHRNLVTNVQSLIHSIEVIPEDNMMLVLPLHHAFAFTTNCLLPMYVQCQVSLGENLRTLREDMRACRPTVLLGVPLLFDKMLHRIQGEIRKNKLGSLLMKVGLGRMVGKKVQTSLGGALRVLVSGGAPISLDTLGGWNQLGFRIIEGYGITETGPVISLNPLNAPRPGTTGKPIDQVEVRIEESNENGVGEIVVRGPSVMNGYLNRPEETACCLRDGWYYTGDLGYFDDAGYLVISGRKKSLIVNREGKNIYPEEVEQQVLRSPWIGECLVLGYREASDAVGERVGLIAVPDQQAFNAEEIRTGTHFSDEAIEDCVRQEVRNQLESLSPYKRPRCVQIRFEEFEKTTTQKIKRYLYAINTVSIDREHSA